MKKSSEWVPLALEGPIVNCSLEGLIGIEELTTYEPNSVVIGNSKKRGKKRKETEAIESLPQKLTKTESKKIKQNTPPGLFVRNPNLIVGSREKPIGGKENGIKIPKKSKKKKQNKSKSNIKAVETKTEEEDTIENDSDAKNNLTECSVEDLKAWDTYSLPTQILKALAELNFTKPTPIQEMTLPPAILGRRDIMGAAETGSGKTLAFGLPILTGIMLMKEKEEKQSTADQIANIDSDQDHDDESDSEDNENEVVDVERKFKQKPLYALILTPTRELAIQVTNHIAAVAKYTGIKVAVVVGGLAAEKQERLLAKGPEIVVATPGRLWELLQDGNPHLSQLDNISFLGIDETDRMLEKGHFAELHQLLERINMDEVKKQKRQNFVFSATLTLVHDLPSHLLVKKKLQGKRTKKINKLTPQQKLQRIIEMLGITNPKIVDMATEGGIASTLTECRITCALEDKDFYVYYFLKKHPGRTLIFCNSIGCVKRLATLLGLLDCGAFPLHASMPQRQRLKNLDRFRDRPDSVLIATDVAARGLDIPNVEHVIHYQTPRTVESYVHRSGRTARATKFGLTMLLIDPTEVNDYRKLCQSLNKTEDLPAFPIEERYMNAVKRRVCLTRKLDQLELKMKRTSSEKGWLLKAAQEMDIVLDGQSDSENEELKESADMKRQIAIVRKELTALLSKPIFPHGFSFQYPTSISTNLLDSGLIAQPVKQATAIEAVKQELDRREKNKKTIKLYKPKLTIAEKKAERKATKQVEKRKKRKVKKEKKMQKDSQMSDEEDA